MPKLLTPGEVLRRAEKLINEAAAISLPDAGRERGVAVRARRSRLGRASRLLCRITGSFYRGGRCVITEAHRQRAVGLGGRIDQLWPEILAHKKYRERRERQ